MLPNALRGTDRKDKGVMKRCVKNGVIKNKFKKGTKIVKIYFLKN